MLTSKRLASRALRVTKASTSSLPQTQCRQEQNLEGFRQN